MRKTPKPKPVAPHKTGTRRAAPPAESASPLIMKYGDGSLERRKGIFIAQLRGSYEEMGRQHAELAKEACGDVTLQYFNRVVENLVAHSLPPAAGAVGHSLKWLFHKRNQHRLGDRMKEHLGAFAEAFDVPAIEAERIFLVPDIIHYLIGRAFPPFAAPPSCSGFFARGEMTGNGRVLVGRNFDFFGRGVWNANNAAIVMHPTGGQSFCWLGALSVPGSAQGFNESGLYVCMHTQFTRDVQTAGEPIFKICHEVLADCRTLDEAIRRILARPRLCGLTLFVVDSRNRNAAAVEFSANRHAIVRPANDLLVQTNHYLTPEMQKLLVVPYPWQRNSHGRRERLVQLLEAKRGKLQPADVPAMLSDCWDVYENRKRLTGNILACVNNAQSLVFSPEDDAVWLANADYPVCHSDRFAGFRLSALLAGDAARYELPDLAGGKQLDETERATLKEYADAWSAHMDQLNNNQAVFHLRRAAALAPDEAIYPRLAGLFLLKQKKYRQALTLLRRNAEYDYRDVLMKAEAYVWVGRCLDLLERREEAKVQYTLAANLNAPPVSDGARRHLKRPFKPRQLFDVSPEFIVGTALSRY
ncbi:MAG: hypothetical protein GX444_02635 [Myxococcales bacterium]|nr:hypothetical protein [Myxococcales bacterium]